MLALVIFVGATAFAPVGPAPGGRGLAVSMQTGRPPKVSSSYYKRPAAAMERGGGFYVPGLEGGRLRVAAASVLAVGLVLNHAFSSEPMPSQWVSEALGAAGCAAVIAQSVAQQFRQKQLERDSFRATLASRLKETQLTGESLDPTAAARAEWAAASLLRLTPARAIVWVDGDALLLRAGRFPEGDGPGVAAASMRELLPAGARSACLNIEQPPPPLPSNAASVAVCRCGESGMLALASEQPAAFTEKHLEWLGQVAALLRAPEQLGS